MQLSDDGGVREGAQGPREHRLQKIPRRGDNSEAARQERLDFVRRQTRADLASAGQTTLRPERLASNLEAMIGGVELPLAAAGPLLFRGEHARGAIYAPLATTEGALVSSVTRGARAVSLSGGVCTQVLAQRMLRAPMFLLADMHEARRFGAFVEANLEGIRGVTRRHSNHADLKEVQVRPMGRAVHLVFVYETGDAAGQNMTTTCTWHACLWLVARAREELRLDASEFIVEGGLASDKKVSHANLVNGRGLRVQAEARIRRSVMQRVLKVDPARVQRFWNHSAAAAAGAGLTGLNTNVANVVAAVFAATGQDLASIHESSLGVLAIDLQPDGDLYLLLTMPGLVIGTVGGGTHLPDARDCLEMLQCRGPGAVRRLGEIIAGYALALDLSTMAAIAAGHFAIAHEKMGRSDRDRDFRLGELTPEFFGRLAHRPSDAPPVTAARPLADVPVGGSIVCEFSARKLKRPVGLFPFRLQLGDGATARREDVMVKIKPTAGEVADIGGTLAALCGEPVAGEYARCRHLTGTDACDRKELAVYAQRDPRFVAHVPRLFGTHCDEPRNAYVLVQELLTDLALMNGIDEVHRWTDAHRRAALAGAASLHAVWYGREPQLQAQPWLGRAPSRTDAIEKQGLYRALVGYLGDELPELFPPAECERILALVDDTPRWWARIERMPRTLVHNDFNPRNMGFRREADGGLRLCAYDWELATLHLPQRDLAELLATTLPPHCAPSQVEQLVEFHRAALERETGASIDADAWQEGFVHALHDFLLSNVLMVGMLHTFRHFTYFERVVATLRRLRAVALAWAEGAPA